MQAALYFPHTNIRNPAMLRDALLLWDRIETIVPWENWEESDDKDPVSARARALIVRHRVPNKEEKRRVHQSVAELVNKGLPKWLLEAADSPPGFDLMGPYSIYTEKLLHETWLLLREAALAREDARDQNDSQVPRAVGLLLMAALAEQCAGTQMERITDQGVAYTSLSGWLLAKANGTPILAERLNAGDLDRRRLVSLSVRLLSTDGVPLERLVALRQEEASRPGSGLSEFRAAYAKRVSDCVAKLSSEARNESDRQEIFRVFEQSMTSDLANLRRELRIEAGKLVLSKEVLVATVVGAGVFVPALPAALQLPALGVLGAAAAGRSLIEYFGGRRKVLTGHAMSWLYFAAAN